MTATETKDPFEILEQSIYAALETYSNVHRGSGHNSMVTTHLYEKAREIILDCLKLDRKKYVVIFCSPERAAGLILKLKPGSYYCISSADLRLPLGIRALAVRRSELPAGAPLQSGGGTARLVSPEWVIWADAPDRFEAGTPAIINVIAFARALLLAAGSDRDIFVKNRQGKLSAEDILLLDHPDNDRGAKLHEKLRETFIGRNVSVPTAGGFRRYINLDNAASTPAMLPVWETVCQTWRQPEDTHNEIITKVKTICANALGAPQEEYEIIFTSNTTESINLVAESLRIDQANDTEPVIINTLIEHNSNDLPWRNINGFSKILIDVDDDGFVDLAKLEKLFKEYNEQHLFGKKRIRLMAVSGCSNVLGVFNDIDKISRIVHRYGAFLLVDAAQVVAHRKIETGKSMIDYLVFSAHKVYAPFGTGVLVIRKDLLSLKPERLKEICSSGEENVVGIAALGKSLVLLQRIGIETVMLEEQKLTAFALKGLTKIEGLTVYGIKDPDSPLFAHKGGVILINVKGMMANRVAKMLAETNGIGTRNGCHCAHILIKRLAKVGPGLERFQKLMITVFPGIKLPGLLRISIGIENSQEDISELINTLAKISDHPPVYNHKIIKQEINDFIKTVENKVY